MHSNQKKGWHPKNKHQGEYDFNQLVSVCPDLGKFVFVNKYGKKTIDFFNSRAVRLLNEAILKCDYRIDWWQLPKGFLCPPVPGRAEYIHRVAELLTVNLNKPINCLDIGVGANCIYPVIGIAEYEWNFVGVDCEPKALESAQCIIDANEVLKDKIVLRRQVDKSTIFKNIIQPNDFFELTVCNPPFHDSATAAKEAALRKNRNLRKKFIETPTLNFGGKNNELWCEGGERKFIETMMNESVKFKSNVHWFTTLVSKGDDIPHYVKRLSEKSVTDTVVIEMSMGNKVSRILCWTFAAKN
jgi:23S rRNA (adenine1618-N6)-methyltransferase